MSQLTDACVCGKTAIIGAHSRAAHVRPDGLAVSGEPFYADETANLKAHVQTLQGRIEALERAMARMNEREIRVRRAVGQLAAAYDLNK